MRRFLYNGFYTKKVVVFLLFIALGKTAVYSQNFSNKGTDFWTGYGPHEKISSGTSDMTLYFTSDDTATVTIYVGNSLFQTLSLAAGTITASNNIPESGAMDARLQNEQVYLNKGVYIHSTSPIVAYAQIWGSQVTATTILFPVKTLGRSYTSLNYTQVSNTSGMRSFFFVVATEDGTTVEVKPSATTATGLPVGTWTQQTLNKGDVWLIKGGTDATDLTGSQIRSVSGAGGTCKKIAVFSGSQKMSVTCSNTTASGDNFFQQAFPMAAWGRKYVTAPTAGLNYTYNIFRVMINPDSVGTVVKVNGVTLPGIVPGLSPAVTPLTPGVSINFTNSTYYEFVTNAPAKIESNIPVMVAQYISNRNRCGNNFAAIGDPDMIYLSPTEQTIDSIIVSPVPTENNDAINYLNVVMKTADVPGFTIRNQLNALVPAVFLPAPVDPTYSYAQVPLAAGYSSAVYYKLKNTSGGFNAIAYGYASSESYAYNAGTNVKNLNQILNAQNPLGTGFTQVCKGTPTKLSVTLAYIPTSMTWQFFSNPNISPNVDVTVNSPVPDSTFVNANGVTLYIFKLAGLYTFNGTGIFPVRILANNPSPDGCNGLEQIDFDVTVKSGPKADFSFTFSGCATNPVQFTDLSIDTVAGRIINRWNWDFGDGIGTSTIQNPNYIYGAGGSFNVTLRAINNEGCYKDTVKTVLLAGSPVANFSVAGSLCTGSTISLTDLSTVSPGSLVKWYWDYGDGIKDTINAPLSPNVSHVYAAGGNYTISLKVENSNGCTATKTLNIFIGTTPFANFTLPGNICLPGGGAQFTNLSSVVGGFPISYVWDFGDGSPFDNTVNPIHNYSTTGPFLVKLTATVGTCSKDTIKSFITLYQKPVVNFTVNPENCLNIATVFTDATTTVNSVISSWDWNFGDGTVHGIIQNPSHVYALAGTYTVKLIITTDKGCIDSISKTVVINQLPTANFNFSTPTCAGQNITFTNTSVANSGTIIEWQWDFGDGNTVTLNNGNPFTHLYNTGGAYTVTLKVKTDKGCFSTLFPRTVVVNATPKPGFNFPANLCLPGAITFTNTTSISDGTLSLVTYSWDFGDGSPLDNNTTPAHSFATGGIYIVTLTATSSLGCSKDSVRTITVFNSPTSSYTITGSLCSNEDVTVTNTSAVAGFGTVNKIELYWDYINDPTNKITDNAPVVGRTYTNQYPTFGVPATKTYRVLLRAFSGAGCSKDSITDVVIKAAPQVLFTPITPVCQEIAPYILSNASDVFGNPGIGVYSGAGILASPLFSPGSAGVGTHMIRYTYTAINGCTDYDDQSITVFPTPVIDLGPDRKVIEGDVITLTPVTVIGNNLSYVWSPVTYLTTSNTLPTPKSKPTDDITYRVTVTSQDGCRATDAIFLKVVKDFIVPNVFSPNKDGINDVWQIDNLELYPSHRLQIFNRYGQVLYETSSYTKPWDGTYKGKDLPVGTYYYIIELGGARAPKKGYVTIVR